jgi:hypothetical protein
MQVREYIYSITIKQHYPYSVEKYFTDFTQARATAVNLLRGKLKQGEAIISFKEEVWTTDGVVSHRITMYGWGNNRNGRPCVKQYRVTVVGHPPEPRVSDPIFTR